MFLINIDGFQFNFNQLLKLIKIFNYEMVQLQSVGHNYIAKTKFHAMKK